MPLCLRLHGIGYVAIRLGLDPLWYGSTLFTRDWFETRTVQFHIGSPSYKWTHLVPDS